MSTTAEQSQDIDEFGGKVMFVDSTYFYHHFGMDPKGLPVYKDAETCRKAHKCIEMSEASPDDPSASCEALEVVIIRPKDLAALQAAYAHSRITSLAEEAEREAEAHYNIAPPHRYHADLDQCKFKRAIAAWLRQKAEEG
jgi:hypothetical protein